MGELVATLSEKVSTVVRSEIQLAIAQATEKGKNLGIGTGFLAAAGVVGLYLVNVLLAAAILGLATVLPGWLAALIVAAVLLIVILVLALLGKKKFDASKKYVPAPQEGFKEDVEAVKKGMQQ
ncbi:phage holin family protein [Georgenia halophila]|uniref:Phage holin family protein n=1 Tax=Georgenia halophila TaxID=620889 RepID=A0ABP8KYA6_9MICO